MEMPRINYSWSLSFPDTNTFSDHNGDYYKSPYFGAFGCFWFLRFYPACDNKNPQIFVYIQGIASNVSELNVNRVIGVGAKHFDGTKKFDSGKYKNWGTNRNFLSQNDIANKTTIQCTVQLTLLNVYDLDGEDITASYIAKHGLKPSPQQEQKESVEQSLPSVRLDSFVSQIETLTKEMTAMKQTLNAIRLRMDEEHKDNNNRLNLLERNMQSLQMNGGAKIEDDGIDAEKLQFKNWLYNTLKLGEYYDLFVENGVTTLDVVKLFTVNELKDMGITKIGDRTKILHAIVVLNRKDMNDNDVNHEGSTAFI